MEFERDGESVYGDLKIMTLRVLKDMQESLTWLSEGDFRTSRIAFSFFLLALIGDN